MTYFNRPMSRRSVLRGLLNGTLISVALPPLEAMFNTHGTAYASGAALPVRMGEFFWGCGVLPTRFVPAVTGAAWQLSDQLQPLAPVKDYLNVVSGMGMRQVDVRAHMGTTISILTGAPAITFKDASGNPTSFAVSQPSMDQIAAASLGNGLRFKSLEVGVDDVGRLVSTHEGDPYLGISHNGPNNMNPPEFSPHALFTRLFGAAPTGTTPKSRTSVLDVVLQDVQALQSRASKVDKVRLDQHTQSIRDLELKLQITAQNCQAPAAVTDPAVIGGNDPQLSRHALMSQLMALALACDQTRVFTYMFTAACSYPVYWQANLHEGFHSLTHDSPTPLDQLHQGHLLIMGALSSFLQELKKVPEGAGNLLDHCAILATSDLGYAPTHDSYTDYPLVFAGGAGGRFKYPGVHYRSPGDNMTRAPLTLLQAASVPVTTFGAGDGLATQAISDILA